MEVYLSERARQSLLNLVDYLSNYLKMPLTAERYADKMWNFGISIGNSPLAWPKCKGKEYSGKNYRCAVFDDKWIFAYAINGQKVIIREIINGALIKE